MRIVFMGTPDFAAASLQKLLDEDFDVVGVFTQPDKPKSRGMKLAASPVKEIALRAGIPVFQPVKMRDGAALEDLQSLKPDLVVVVAYGRILPDELLAVPPLGTINIHGSLLPKYRGAAPIQWAVLNGDRTAGVTSMYLATEIDSGDMQEKLPQKTPLSALSYLAVSTVAAEAEGGAVTVRVRLSGTGTDADGQSTPVSMSE